MTVLKGSPPTTETKEVARELAGEILVGMGHYVPYSVLLKIADHLLARYEIRRKS